MHLPALENPVTNIFWSLLSQLLTNIRNQKSSALYLMRTVRIRKKNILQLVVWSFSRRSDCLVLVDILLCNGLLNLGLKRLCLLLFIDKHYSSLKGFNKLKNHLKLGCKPWSLQTTQSNKKVRDLRLRGDKLRILCPIKQHSNSQRYIRVDTLFPKMQQ